MNLIENLKKVLKANHFKGLCDNRTEEEVASDLFAEVQDPVAIKTEGNQVAYRWDYEFPGYQTKNNQPHIVTFEWVEEFDEEDNSKIVKGPKVI